MLRGNAEQWVQLSPRLSSAGRKKRVVDVGSLGAQVVDEGERGTMEDSVDLEKGQSLRLKVGLRVGGVLWEEGMGRVIESLQRSVVIIYDGVLQSSPLRVILAAGNR